MINDTSTRWSCQKLIIIIYYNLLFLHHMIITICSIRINSHAIYRLSLWISPQFDHTLNSNMDLGPSQNVYCKQASLTHHNIGWPYLHCCVILSSQSLSNCHVVTSILGLQDYNKTLVYKRGALFPINSSIKVASTNNVVSFGSFGFSESNYDNANMNVT